MHTNPQTTVNRKWPFESSIPHDSEDKDACSDEPISSGWSPPPAQETTTDTRGPGRQSLLLGHITQHEPLWSVQARRFSVVLLWCFWWSLYWCFFFFWIMLPFLSVLFVFLCVFYFWLVSVCVHVRLSRKLWLLSLSWGKLKEKDWGERGAESGVIDSMCGTSWHRGHLHTHTCPSLKMSGSLIGQIVVMRPVGMEIRADTLDIWGKSLIRFLSESWMRRWIPLSCLYAKCKSVAMRQLA